MLDNETVTEKFGQTSQSFDEISDIDGVILINGHEAFSDVTLAALKDKMRTPVIFDVKNFFDKQEAAELGYNYKSL